MARQQTVLDPTFGDPELARMRTELDAGRWDAVAQTLESTTDALRREFLFCSVVSQKGRPAFIDQWLGARPGSWVALAYAGGHAVEWAFEARTGAVPQLVQAEQWETFRQRLEYAEQLLDLAASADPSTSIPWLFKLKCGLGTGAEVEHARKLWDEVFSRNPASEEGARMLARHIGPRWHGDEKTMWDFINELIDGRDAGDGFYMLVPYGHIEAFLELRMSNAPRVHPSRYFEQAPVQQSLRAAYQKYTSAPRNTPWDRSNREWFAACFYLMGDRELLAQELNAIGSSIRRLPWAFLGSPLVAYESARQAAGLK